MGFSRHKRGDTCRILFHGPLDALPGAITAATGRSARRYGGGDDVLAGSGGICGRSSRTNIALPPIGGEISAPAVVISTVEAISSWIGRFLSFGVSHRSRISSPPRSQRLSRWRNVFGDSPKLSIQQERFEHSTVVARNKSPSS